MKLEDLLTTYWSQITLILLGIGYFFKRWFDNKSKKIEINHSLFQQNRLNSIKEFFESYTNAEQLWNHLSIYEVLSHKISAKELDNLVFPSINRLDKSLLELMIFFEDKEYLLFKGLVDNVKSINSRLSQLYFGLDNSPNLSLTQKAIEYDKIKKKVFSSNEEIISNLK